MGFNPTSSPAFQQSKTVRVVLLGKTGVGKSSLGNTLLGDDKFLVVRGLSSGTEKCDWATVETDDGLHLEVTDTPGLCDTHRSDREILREISKSVAVAAPGPHVILVVIRCDRPFTWEEHHAYTTLKKLFGDGIKKFMIVVFAGIDTFDGDHEGRERALKEHVDAVSGSLAESLADANGRYLGVNNRASREDRNRQATKLIAMMEGLMAENDGAYFSNDLCERVGAVVEENIQRRMQTTNTTDRALAERQTRKDITAERVRDDFWDKVLDIVNKALTLALQITSIVSDVRTARSGGSMGGGGATGGEGNMSGCHLM